MDKTKILELLGKHWWGIMVIGLIIYLIGLQRFFGDWALDPIVCTIIQLVGIIIITVGYFQSRKKWNKYKKGIKAVFWILFIIVIISSLLGICYMWNKKPLANSTEPQQPFLEETTTPILTFTPEATQTSIPPTPTLTSEQQIVKNIELLETYLNNEECERAFNELFTEKFQENYWYSGFCTDEWNYFTNIELSVKETPNVPNSETIGSVVISIEREHINYLGTPVPTSDQKVCYMKLDDKWLIDEMYTNISRNCKF